MTLQEFKDDVTTWGDLYSFCNDYGFYGYVDDLVFDDDLDENICDDMNDATHHMRWTEIRSWLNDISEGYDCYRRNGGLDYVGLDDNDLEDIKDDIIENADEDFWDEEDDEDEPDFDLDAIETDELHGTAVAMTDELESRRQEIDAVRHALEEEHRQFIMRLQQEEKRKAEEQEQYEIERKNLFMDFMSDAMFIRED